MFGRKCGWGTGLILMTSPLCWFHGEIALSTIVDSALVVSFVFVCWRAIQQGVTWFRILEMAALLAAIAGVRAQSAPLLIPLWLYVLWGFARPCGRKLPGAIALVVGFSLLWFVPTVKSAGSIASYVHLLRLKSQIDAPRIVWGGGGMGALLNDVYCMGSACWVGLPGVGIIALTELIFWIVFAKPRAKDGFIGTHNARRNVLLLWIVPTVLFGMFMYVALPGHILNFFPAVAILSSLGLVGLAERLATRFSINRSWTLGFVLFLLVAVNAIVFVWPPRWAPRVLPGLPLTRMEIHQHDVDLSTCFRVIRDKWPLGNIVICHRLESFYWGFPQFEYYLPEYSNVMLAAHATMPGAAGTNVWIGYMHRTTFQSSFEVADGQQIILVVPPGESVNLFETSFDIRRATLVIESGAKLYQLQ